ncbi:MAG: flagellar brake protein [Gammaproteobacteria bacterium]|nr:flagellar brake protein [Gammaproteobacteria bacterium]MBU1601330.1 flagellar brake protein [Gammaproteobacteria bacterium]MBU2433911.1 flagellar brake protein [Gammaproteobacteria bacterium]MBU2450571.1 flagellar brake protein [Gammaproteobacteria bacterium]
MSQIAQLSEAEIEARFHVTGTLPIAFMLVGFARTKDQFTVSFGGEDVMLTTLLDAQPAGDRLVLDCSGSADINRRFLESRHNVFAGRPGGIHVQFTTGQATEVNFEGSKAFAVPLPKHIVRLQRRDTFRIETPRGKPLQFFGRLAGGKLLNCPAHDISVAGLGMTALSLPDGLAPGDRLENCHFALPEDEHELFFSATVRHITPQVGRTGLQQWRIGLHFENMPAVEENRIQRYIAKVERERHELLAK